MVIIDGVIHAFNMDKSNYVHPVYSARFADGCTRTIDSHPRPLIETFQAGQMPEDLVEGLELPIADRAAKDLVLGGNLARLQNLELSRVPADDPFAELRSENPAPWSRIRSAKYA